MSELTLEVRGMSCGHCVGQVKKAIEKAGGSATDVRIGSARAEFDPGVTDAAAIVAAIGEAGYPAFEVK